MNRSRSGYGTSTRWSVTRMPPCTRARARITNRCGGSCVHSKVGRGSALTRLLVLGRLRRLERGLQGREDAEDGVEVRDAEDRRDALARAHQEELPSLPLEPLQTSDQHSD